jgi:hypothetical protein
MKRSTSVSLRAAIVLVAFASITGACSSSSSNRDLPASATSTTAFGAATTQPEQSGEPGSTTTTVFIPSPENSSPSGSTGTTTG